MPKKGKTVAVLGASPKPERYSNQAVKALLEHGYDVIPVNPIAEKIHGLTSLESLDDIPGQVDTLTVYINQRLSWKLCKPIIKLNPRRAIFNPGSENFELERLLAERGVEIVHACTLVMLRTDQL